MRDSCLNWEWYWHDNSVSDDKAMNVPRVRDNVLTVLSLQTIQLLFLVGCFLLKDPIRPLLLSLLLAVEAGLFVFPPAVVRRNISLELRCRSLLGSFTLAVVMGSALVLDTNFLTFQPILAIIIMCFGCTFIVEPMLYSAMSKDSFGENRPSFFSKAALISVITVFVSSVLIYYLAQALLKPGA